MIKSPQIDELNETTRLLQEAIVKKDIEISKLRQNAQLLQTNIDELQFELEKAKGRLPNLEKANESEKTELK